MRVILKRPIITEKANQRSEDLGQYTFIVDKNANKFQIAKAVEDMFSVKVTSVKTMNYMGKKRSRFTKTRFVEGKNANYKKAMVHIEEGQEIDFYQDV